MLKKLFFTAALSAFALWGAAQTTISGEKLWNFSDGQYVDGDSYNTQTIDGLTFGPTDKEGNYWVATSTSVEVEGISYSIYLKSGGSNKTMSFTTSSAGTIRWLVKCGGNDERTVSVTVNETQQGTAQVAPLGTPAWQSQFVNEGGVVTLTSPKSNYFYAVEWIPSTQSANVKLSAPTSNGRIELDATITATFSGEATDVTASYTSGGASNDIVVEGSGTTYTLNFDKTYSTTYEVTVTGMVDGETVTATQSYTTIDEPVQLNIEPTTVTTTWPLPTQAGSSIIDNTLAIVDCYAVTDTYFSLKRIDQTGDKPGYMYFLVPAGVQGRLIINAMSDTRDVYYYTTTNTTILTANELNNIQSSGQATMMGQPALTGSTLTAEISSDANAQTLVYIFCKRGQIDFQSVT